MAKLTDEVIQEALNSQLHEGESLKSWAFGVKQPNIWLLIVLIACAVLPGLIAVILLTKNYLIGLTDKRFIVLTIKGMGNAEIKEVTEYGLDEIKQMDVNTSTGKLFTHIEVKDEAKPFKAKFHRAFSKNNRPAAMAIADAIA